MMRAGPILLLFLLSFCISAGAQNSTEDKTGQAAVAPKQITEYTLPPDKLRQAEALYKLDMKFAVLGPLYGWLVLLWVLRSGIAARYQEWAKKVSCYRIVQAFIFVPLLLLTLGLFSLPLNMYGHHISVQYGLSVQKWGSWFADYGKGRAINIGIYIVALWLLQSFIRWSPRRWWFYFGLAIVPVIFFFAFIWPIYVDPLFNKFELLEARNPQLVEEIEKVTQRGGLNIPRSRMYEMEASEKVTTLNAYVTGFGASKRVVVWDTTIQKMTTPETLLVFGHEMGHYVLHHIIYGLAATCLGVLIALYIIFHLSRWLWKRFGERWHIRALQDWTAAPMFFLLYGVLFFLTQPVANTLSRYVEHQADIYGMEVTHGLIPNQKETAAHSFQVLGELSLDYPYPSRLAVVWFWTHPPISDRVRFAQEYDPWAKGESPKYVRANQ